MSISKCRSAAFMAKFSSLSYRSLLVAFLLSGGNLVMAKMAIGANPLPGAAIENQATASFVDTLDNSNKTVVSDIVTTTVAEVAGVTVVAEGMTGTPAPGNTVFFNFRITNVGNDPTRLFIPGIPSSVTNGTAGSITVIEYDPDGSGSTAPTPISSNNTVLTAGSDTGTLNGIPNNGSIPANGTILVQIPVTIATSVTGSNVSMTLGNTSPANGQNVVYVNGGNDLYTIDNNGASNGDFSGAPVNGDSVNHRQEASATQTVPLILPDRSDAPTSYGEATHLIVSGMRLGAAVDGEAASISNATASGDGTDDDGISSFPVLNPGATSYSIPAANINAVGTGTLHAWIDFNKNGTFDVGEYASVTIANNALAGDLNWTGITAGTAGRTFARFRFTSDATIIASTPSSSAADGEVEDYQLPIVSASALVCGTIYGSYNNGGIFNGLRGYNPSSGSLAAQIATLATPGGSTTAVAAIAVDPLIDGNGNRRVYYIENTGAGAKLFYYDGSNVVDTGTALTVPYSSLTTVRSDGTTGTLNNTFNRMGFAPDGTLYIADAQKTFHRFSPNRLGTGGSLSAATTIIDNPNNDIGNAGRAQIGQSGGGDIAFDNAGHMYIVTYDSDSLNVPTEFRLFQILDPQSATPIAVLLGREPSTDTVAGLAFQSSDNTLYMQGSGGKSFGWNLATNTVINFTPTSPGSADLGSCTYPDLNPSGAFTKTVANITNPGAKALSANDILEFTLNFTNNGNLVAGNVTLVDNIPAGTTYVAGSTKLNGIAKADDAGAMPYSNAVNPQTINSPGEASGVLTVGPARKATVVFRVKVNAANSKVCNQSTVFYDGAPSIGILSDDPTTTGVVDDSTCTGANKAKLLLVKRITAIQRSGEVVPESFTDFVDDSSSTTPTGDDNHCNWPGATGAAGACTNTYTVGKTAIPDVQTGDEIEYTIYYLNAGGNPAKQARICDQLDANLTFQTQFDSSDVNTVDKGIVLVEGSTTAQYFTNTASDSDRGNLTTPILATSCNLGARVGGNLSNDVVVVDVGTATNLLMNSTSPGSPTTSYGYIRFRAKVN